VTVLATYADCQAGGMTIVHLNWESQQSGSSSDQAAFRVVRRADGEADVALPGEPRFYMGGNRDVRGWTFIDANVPNTKRYSYVVQIMRLNGGGTFYGMNLIASHYRR